MLILIHRYWGISISVSEYQTASTAAPLLCYRCVALLTRGCSGVTWCETGHAPSPLVPGLGLLVVIRGSEQTAQVHHGNIVRRLEPDSLLVVSGRQLALACTTGEKERKKERL